MWTLYVHFRLFFVNLNTSLSPCVQLQRLRQRVGSESQTPFQNPFLPSTERQRSSTGSIQPHIWHREVWGECAKQLPLPLNDVASIVSPVLPLIRWNKRDDKDYDLPSPSTTWMVNRLQHIGLLGREASSVNSRQFTCLSVSLSCDTSGSSLQCWPGLVIA